ncbi:enoyl-CoA hydratase/isomerase family protein [Fodinibius sp.]|uniref:enoyl-CoA hydratase/isomerase family protein n=1 Tax=Fodinibius sp. TaxID=1872440 RepID=UPI002ACE28ED|nr:enoyl-CoA hydratase/isomerase family protein [Fodinibius sp.]MDZ7659958.1 enoyl-CoA hydratase/isomerase family protein [Fodinibius sp.]
MSVLKVEQKNHICQATIHRPESHNAINFAVMDELENLLDELEQDSNIRCFILSGSGQKTFVSGGDLQEFHTIKTAEEAKPMARRMLTILKRIEQLPCWTIAAINGAAYGGGCEMMLAFDFRMAAPGATFGFTQGKFYLPPGWGGLTRLVEKIGRSTALLWLAEAKVVESQTALRHNLIDHITESSDWQDEIWERAQNLTKNDRPFIKNLKEGAMRITQARWKAIEAELDSFAKFWESDLHEERVENFLNRK